MFPVTLVTGRRGGEVPMSILVRPCASEGNPNRQMTEAAAALSDQSHRHEARSPYDGRGAHHRSQSGKNEPSPGDSGGAAGRIFGRAPDPLA
jgi:hypothetical protein